MGEIIVRDSSGKVLQVSRGLKDKGLVGKVEGKDISKEQLKDLTKNKPKSSSKSSTISNSAPISSSQDLSGKTIEGEVIVTNYVVGAVRDNSRPTQGIYRQLISDPNAKKEYIPPSNNNRNRVVSGEFTNSQGQGMSINPALVQTGREDLGYGVTKNTFADNRVTITQRVATRGSETIEVYNQRIRSNDPMFEPRTTFKTIKEKATIVSNIVDYPVTKTQELFFSQPSPTLHIFGKNYKEQNAIIPFSINEQGKFSTDLGSYLIPYYGTGRFVKDVGMYGLNVADNPSYIYREGKFETAGLLLVAGIKGGSLYKKKFVNDPLTSEFKNVEQTGFFKKFDRVVDRENNIRFTETNKDFIGGATISKSGDIMKNVKTTTTLVTPKTSIVEFNIYDKGLGVSRSGTRKIVSDIQLGSSKIIDEFSVNKLGKTNNYLKITDVSPTGEFSTRIFNTKVKVQSKSFLTLKGVEVRQVVKPIMEFKGSSQALSFTIGSKPKELINSFTESDRKLTSMGSFKKNSIKFVGDKDSGFLVSTKNSRVVTQDVKLSKYYSVETTKELGISLDRKGIGYSPIESSKTTKNILRFGNEGKFDPNTYNIDNFKVVSSKNPIILENIFIKEDININYKKLSSKESRKLVKEYKNSLPKTYNLGFGKIYSFSKANPSRDFSLSKSKKASLGLNTQIFKPLIENKPLRVVSVPKSNISQSFNSFNAVSSPKINLNSNSPKLFFSNKQEIKTSTLNMSKLDNLREFKRDTKIETSIKNDLRINNVLKIETIQKQEIRQEQKQRQNQKQQQRQEQVQQQKQQQRQEQKQNIKTEFKTFKSTFIKEYSKTKIIPFIIIPKSPRYNVSKGVSRVKKQSNNLFLRSPKESYRGLASLSEVFKFEQSTGIEAGYTRSKRAKRIFENQLFGRGNFNTFIKVER